MQKRNLTTLTAIVLLLVMIAVVLISSTLAKYATEFTGTDTVTVAKWNVSVEDLTGTPMTAGATFNLFEESNIYDLDGITVPEGSTIADVDLSTVTTVADSDVKTGKIVAPGTWGKVGFQVVVKQDNEVSVNYGVTFSDVVNDSNIPLQFSLNGSEWVNDPADLEAAGTVTLAELAGGDVTKTATLYWRWLYERNADAADTALGEATPTYQVTASFGATQAD